MFKKLNKQEQFGNLNKIQKNCTFYAKVYEEIDFILST